MKKFKLPSLRDHLIFWPIAIGGVAADLWSKSAVFAWLGENWVHEVVPGFLNLVMAENSGAAFSIAQGRRMFLVGISVVALTVVVLLFLAGKVRGVIATIAMGLLAAGISGNLYDRVFNAGLVRDFIDVYYGRWHWPAFNLADSMLCVAVGLIIVMSFLEREGTSGKGSGTKE